MDRITAMQVFTEVADRASLTDAAGALDMSRAMVSRYLESLERWLGVRLLHRTTRRVSLTDAGEELVANDESFTGGSCGHLTGQEHQVT